MESRLRNPGTGYRLRVKRDRDIARLRNTHCVRLHALLLEFIPGGVRDEMTVAKTRDPLEQAPTGDQVATTGS